MGICLDTDKIPDDEHFKNGSKDRDNWEADDIENANKNDAGMFAYTNGHVKFDTPKVPVIFVLGGPGSGKVTHCDNLMIEKRGIVHINMTDLLQQYTVGNDMEDFSKLSSKTVTEVLMLELKMSPAAKTFLVSGFPRSMRDVVEYTNKIKVVNGVILISWNQNVLERQIDYGAKLGHVVLSLARMELNNFYKNVTPVSDFYDQRGMLISVNGERSPTEVYNDFRSSVLQILSAHKSPTTVAVTNGTVPVDRSGTGQPEVVAERPTSNHTVDIVPEPRATDLVLKPETFPRTICVVGGPGSNKSSLCQKVLRANAGWGHVSVGPLMRSLASSLDSLQETISCGHIVEESIVHEILDKELLKYKNADGIVIDGYPRNIGQLNYFEKKYAQRPKLILLDCSKLQLGRGRLDDSVSAFRRRLQSFREQTLPMLKALDKDNRLAVVDGNTDDKRVQETFISTLVETMKGENFPVFHRDDDDHGDDVNTDIDPEKQTTPAVVVGHVVSGPAVPRQNGHLPNKTNEDNNNREQHLRYDVRNMYAQIGSYANEPTL
ncbi:PREDICTED: adenylate kinase isoenzyme 5 [Diuraphis noxia]|uniref:adenylate kinase isoenzyme 5 n=1 Tax=Diuraphis noxia TaxID=143948 RepID=UPI0007636EB0|nr:PREDICTED: adenylate kinase isoenzyme 5 [Diuraphis noxia]XP_015373048.1 PREDICTED: adenylate kinase isoenzyme 5 [Diuraphis noxia]XP_015373049.1 PREDICTED: adenylate kinase isoenzyme 5 [Diuraphis noxia]